MAVAGLVTIRFGRNGRFFSCFSRWLAAANSSRCDRDLRPAVDRDRNELGHRLLGRDQCNLDEGGLNRFEQCLGIKEQDVRKDSTCDLPIPQRKLA